MSKKVVVIEGFARLRTEFLPRYLHPKKLDKSVPGFMPDCSQKRDILDLQAVADELEAWIMKRRLYQSGTIKLFYESAGFYRIGTARAHILTRYHPTYHSIGVREYCGLPWFPERMMKMSIYFSQLAAFAHVGSPRHRLFDEPDVEHRANFIRWYASQIEHADTFFGVNAVREFRDFRRNFHLWAPQHLLPVK